MGPVDVLVVGAGPAGMAVAAACRERGLVTGIVDPNPDRPWTATYGMWSRELPPDLPSSVVAAQAAGRAIALTEHRLGWDYVVLDVPALHGHLAERMAGVSVYTGRAVGCPEPGVLALADGSQLRARVIVDAGGRWRPLGSASSRNTPASQTAYGVVVDRETAAPLVRPGHALFMDWRRDHGESGWSTFLYGVPLDAEHVLLEETSLARRPGLPLPTLRRRLYKRLAHHGIAVPDDAYSEKVSFPVDQPRHRGAGVLGFGAAAPLVHPASGFSVAASLQLAPRVADAVATHLTDGPTAALRAARRTVWPRRAEFIHRLRRIGLEALLRMPPADVPGFFEQFFALPDAHRWTYLTARDDVPGTMSAMTSLFRAADPRLRRQLMLPAVLRPVRSNDAGDDDLQGE